jgi:hypothetical protein
LPEEVVGVAQFTAAILVPVGNTRSLLTLLKVEIHPLIFVSVLYLLVVVGCLQLIDPESTKDFPNKLPGVRTTGAGREKKKLERAQSEIHVLLHSPFRAFLHAHVWDKTLASNSKN